MCVASMTIMYYNLYMDTTIRNLDEEAYRSIKARAALEGKTIGQVVSEAMRAYVARPGLTANRGTLSDLVPEAYPDGTEHLSEEIDAIVYGTPGIDCE